MTDLNLNAILFNCCTDNREPDWKQFDWLETGGCVEDKEEGITHGGIDDAEAEFWTVYAHLKVGGVEAITDCKTRAEVDAVAEQLSVLSKLPVR